MMESTGILIIGLAAVCLVLFAIIMKLQPSSPLKQKITVRLVEKVSETHDTMVLTFMLPDNSRKMGLRIGEHIEVEQNIKGEIVKRKYTPISRIDRVGSFVLLLKIYRPTPQFPDGGKMSCFLADLPHNSQISISYPFGRFIYLGRCNTQITSLEGRVTQRKYGSFQLVAGGTGITPIFQLIQYCCENDPNEQRPELHLLFCNRTEQDILMKSTLDAFSSKYGVKVYYSVDKSVKEGWKGFTGYVNEEKITQSMPSNKEKTLFMSCGPAPLCNGAEAVWKKIGVPMEQIYRF